MNMEMPELPPPFSFKKGKLYAFICRVCQKQNGCCICASTEELEREKRDRFSPVNEPCVHCGQKTVEMLFEGDV